VMVGTRPRSKSGRRRAASPDHQFPAPLASECRRGFGAPPSIASRKTMDRTSRPVVVATRSASFNHCNVYRFRTEARFNFNYNERRYFLPGWLR